MSRTDKDRPRHVRVKDPLVPTYEDHDHRDGYCDLADAGDKPDRRGWHRYAFECEVELQFEKFFAPPKKEDLNNAWYSPIRMRDRDDAIRMRKEFNSSGTVDDEVWLPVNHRHNCFNGGWWD